MPEHDAHHAALTANLILDRGVLLHAGCQQLATLLRRLNMSDSYPAIIEVGSKDTFAEPLIVRGLGNKEVREKKVEELAAYNRIQNSVFSECRALVQTFRAH